MYANGVIVIEKVGQHFIIGLRGPTLLPEEREFLIKYNIGGVILFDRNLQSPEQIHALCTELHSLREETKDHAPMIIGIDMEGGRVHRLKPPFTKWPALKHISAQAARLPLRRAKWAAYLAPCVDVS